MLQTLLQRLQKALHLVGTRQCLPGWVFHGVGGSSTLAVCLVPTVASLRLQVLTVPKVVVLIFPPM